MNVADDLRVSEREDVAIVEDVLFAIGETFSARLLFTQSVSADRRAHGAIENENAFLQGGGEFGSKIR